MNTATLKVEPTPVQETSSRGYVLIVDDEEHNRTLLGDPLKDQGYWIAEAQNGAEALRIAEHSAPDAILLDVMMPGMDGFDVCRRLKGNEKTAPTPVLMVTALSEREERLRGIGAGANDFLTKPIDVQDVLLRVKNAVYSKHVYDQLQAEKRKCDNLLFNTFPKWIAERMKSGEVNIADHFPEATVLVTDLVGFTALSANVGPEQIVCLLNEIFTAFDALTESRGLEKIKTIGDAYMVAAGIPLPRSDQAEVILQLAGDLRAYIEQFNGLYGMSLRLRTGVCTGPVIAGVIGRKKFAYDLWGDTVNITTRLTSSAEPGSILVSDSTFQRVKNRMNLPQFSLQPHPKVMIKGIGELMTYAF